MRTSCAGRLRSTRQAGAALDCLQSLRLSPIPTEATSSVFPSTLWQRSMRCTRVYCTAEYRQAARASGFPRLSDHRHEGRTASDQGVGEHLAARPVSFFTLTPKPRIGTILPSPGKTRQGIHMPTIHLPAERVRAAHSRDADQDARPLSLTGTSGTCWSIMRVYEQKPFLVFYSKRDAKRDSYRDSMRRSASRPTRSEPWNRRGSRVATISFNHPDLVTTTSRRFCWGRDRHGRSSCGRRTDCEDPAARGASVALSATGSSIHHQTPLPPSQRSWRSVRIFTRISPHWQTLLRRNCPVSSCAMRLPPMRLHGDCRLRIEEPRRGHPHARERFGGTLSIAETLRSRTTEADVRSSRYHANGLLTTR